MTNKGYRNTSPEKTFYFPVSDDHELYVEICGNPSGIPVVFLHGGPGSNINEKCRWFFNPDKYRVILFDQRGTGKSKPFLSLTNNTPFSTVEDIEALRTYLGIEKWIVFGGSYGSTLALVYGIVHPERILHMVLRGIFLGRKEDIDWLFQEGASYIYPAEYKKFRDFIVPPRQNNLLHAYYDLMHNHDEKTMEQACKHWSDWENGLLRIENDPIPPVVQPSDLSGALLETHYFVNGMFWSSDNYILENIDRVKDIPIDIYHGRFDMDCRVKGAYELKEACKHANLNIVQRGSHYPYDSPLFDELTNRMDELTEMYKW